MSERSAAQKRGICTLYGMAAGFRVFYAAAVDSEKLLGSAWISVLLGMILALPAALSLIAVRRCRREENAAGAVRALCGKTGLQALSVLYLSVMVYDAGAALRMMSSAAKYVAMPQANKTVILLVTALAASVCTALGTQPVAGSAVLWRRLAAVLLAVLVITQIPYFRMGWLTPVLGPGIPTLFEEAIPAAGIFSFTAAAWLMMEPENDRDGRAMLNALLGSGLVTTAVTVAFLMLVPSMTEGQQMRTVRLGWMLTNGRAGLSLEMPYVVLLYSGFLTLLLFELAAGTRLLGTLFPALSRRWRAGMIGAAAFLIAASGLAEQAAVNRASSWYYPVMTVPAVICGAAALMRMRKRGGKA